VTDPAPAATRPAFAHASEAELARILDFYAVRWAYEPDTFPIAWNLDGDVIESFSPDFYLPDFELYVELTTLKQKLVRKKNRKLRRLRELYPGIRIKLFYARDFRAMMLKYGRLALAESLSGTPGQVVPDRTPIEAQPADEPEPIEDLIPVVELPADVVEGDPVLTPIAPVATSPTAPRASKSRSRAARRRRQAAAGPPIAPERAVGA
jgi:hypothetical protein